MDNIVDQFEPQKDMRYMLLKFIKQNRAYRDLSLAYCEQCFSFSPLANFYLYWLVFMGRVVSSLLFVFVERFVLCRLVLGRILCVHSCVRRRLGSRCRWG
mgnify:CR=1 FL=1